MASGQKRKRRSGSKSPRRQSTETDTGGFEAKAPEYTGIIFETGICMNEGCKVGGQEAGHTCGSWPFVGKDRGFQGRMNASCNNAVMGDGGVARTSGQALRGQSHGGRG